MKEIKELLKSFGYEIQFVKKEEKKTRFSSDDDFIDIWESRKGITIGIYNPETKMMTYKKRCNLEDIEKAIT